ncbi:hypothetical protein [Streptomyces sp. NPDC058291]|uniref:hypothetical protein n=1 Tax=Streptomyces sp. NPDC058291 TaxID=3346427 RepID=UPI0036EFCDB3
MAVVAVWLAVYGVGAVVWRALMDKTWPEALAFAGMLAIGNAVGQWVARRVRRRQGLKPE